MSKVFLIPAFFIVEADSAFKAEEKIFPAQTMANDMSDVACLLDEALPTVELPLVFNEAMGCSEMLAWMPNEDLKGYVSFIGDGELIGRTK